MAIIIVSIYHHVCVGPFRYRGDGFDEQRMAGQHHHHRRHFRHALVSFVYWFTRLLIIWFVRMPLPFKCSCSLVFVSTFRISFLA